MQSISLDSPDHEIVTICLVMNVVVLSRYVFVPQSTPTFTMSTLLPFKLNFENKRLFKKIETELKVGS